MKIKKSRKPHIPLDNTLIGLVSVMNPFAKYDSSPRLGMLHNHETQAPQPRNADIPLILHGAETQLRAYDIRMPEDGIVISVHQKYRKTMGAGSIKGNPLTTIVYQNRITSEIDIVQVYEFNTNHKNYGSRYVMQPIMSKLTGLQAKGMFIPKGTIFAKSPAKLTGDIYSNSVTLNVLAIGDHACIEDGFGISDEACERAGLIEIISIHQSSGKNRFLLNKYGTEQSFKGIPDIGDVVGEDGILMAFRTNNPLLDALGMTNKSLTVIDHDHDEKIHVDPGYIVYDVTVDSGVGETTTKQITSAPMMSHANRYMVGQSAYYQELLDLYALLVKDKQHPPLLSPKFTQLITRAIADKPNNPANKSKVGGRVRRARKGEMFDELEITIKLYRPVPLTYAAKLTDLNGNKGVICNIRPKNRMPYDSNGNVADLIYYFKAGVARLNTGGLVEGYIGAAIRDLSHEIQKRYNTCEINGVWNEFHQNTWDRLVDFYKQCSDLCYGWATSPLTDDDKISHINGVIKSTARIILPLDSPTNTIDIIRNIGSVIEPTYGDIYLTDFLGRPHKLNSKGLIQTKQIIILEKSKLNPMAVSGALRQIHGLPSGSNKNIRNSRPSKVHALVNLSETEVRFLAALWGGDLIAEYIAFNNDPEAHKNLVYQILTADSPINLPDMSANVNNSRAVKIVKDILTSYGVELVSN